MGGPLTQSCLRLGALLGLRRPQRYRLAWSRARRQSSQCLLDIVEVCCNRPFQLAEATEYYTRRFNGGCLVRSSLVPIDREIVLVRPNLLHGHKERLRRPIRVLRRIPPPPPRDD